MGVYNFDISNIILKIGLHLMFLYVVLAIFWHQDKPLERIDKAKYTTMVSAVIPGAS